MSPAPRRSPTPTPSRRLEDLVRHQTPTTAPVKREHGDPTRKINYLPAAERAAVLERGETDGLDEDVERLAEVLFSQAENLAPGDTWAWALDQANRRIRGAA